jgi:hypothetical protein
MPTESLAIHTVNPTIHESKTVCWADNRLDGNAKNVAGCWSYFGHIVKVTLPSGGEISSTVS